jgi:hypothetical protein
MQATIWAKEGKASEAAALLERKILRNLQDNLATLSQLVKLNMTEGNQKAAQQLAAQRDVELWLYSQRRGRWAIPCLVRLEATKWQARQ